MSMSDPRSFDDSSSVDDEVLANLLETALQQLQSGEPLDIEELVAEHPHAAEELRELLDAVFVTEEVVRSRSDVGGDDTASSVSTLEVPVDEPPAGFGDFDIETELGRGGMGVVYRAKQKSLGRTVALKVLRQGHLASTEEIARFRTEAQSAAQLDHPSIVSVYEVGDVDGRTYFTMRCVDGETLAQRLTRGPMSGREAARILLAVSRAIQFAHDAGVLHRDLKPSNIMLDERGIPHVTDFGLAKRMSGDSELTRTGAIVGSPSYMAPEQAAGSRGTVDCTTDVYGLGAVLYHVLTGRPPFQAATALDTVLAVLEQEPPAPRLLQPGVDRDLEMIALKCLQKPQDLRYASAAELANDLEAYLNEEPVSARSTNVLQVIQRAFRETHHAELLESWGLLWILHSFALLALCVLSNVFQIQGVASPGPYIAMWTIGLGTWAAIFWSLRRRSGPITFVERQIAHLWGAGIISSTFLFFVEIALEFPVLTLSPVLPIISGSVFLVKGGILTGQFYVQAAVLYACAAVMPFIPTWSLTFFGVISALSFFVPGVQYYSRRRAAERKRSS